MRRHRISLKYTGDALGNLRSVRYNNQNAERPEPGSNDQVNPTTPRRSITGRSVLRPVSFAALLLLAWHVEIGRAHV